MDNKSKDKIVGMLKEAITLEKEGEAYYKKAVSETTDRFSKNLLKRLSEDEVDHGSMLSAKLEEIVAGKDITPVELWTNKNISKQRMEIFPQDINQIKKELTNTDENLAVLKTAIQKEQYAVTLYTDAHKEADDENLKKFLAFLIQMEKQHKEILTDYLNFLEEPAGGWDTLERWACQS